MQTIGFIGIGIMGKAMVRNLLKAGYKVVVYNRTAAPAEELKADGASLAASPAELAAQCDAVVLMLTGPEACDAVLFGQDGAAAELSGKPVVNMSSVAPSYSRDLAARLEESGAILLDAPVSGSKKPAEDGTLIILASGPKNTVDAFEKPFLAMGKKVVYCGEAGMGSMMKMMINHLLGVMVEAFAETLRYGQKGGLDMDAMLDVILSGPLGCAMFQMKAPMIQSGEYPVNFPLKHMAKDMKFVVDTACELGAFAPVANAAMQAYQLGVALGMGDEDLTAVDKVFQCVTMKD